MHARQRLGLRALLRRFLNPLSSQPLQEKRRSTGAVQDASRTSGRRPTVGPSFSKRRTGRGLDLKPLLRSLASMSKSSGKKKSVRPGKALLLGVGLDSDGHKRVTTGPNFALVGGTQETHEVMTEKAIKINEKLAAKGKSLEQVSREEFDDIASSVGLHRQEPQQR